MKERTIRFGYLGVIFLLTMVFAIWYTGGHLPHFSLVESNSKLIELLILVISTPGLGFLLSSIAIGLLRICRKQKHEFLLPPSDYEQKYYKFIHDSFSRESSGIHYDELGDKYSLNNFETLYINHQILLRGRDKVEVINFLTRRMDIYWTHVNTIFSIISGFFIGLLISCPFFNRPFDYFKVFWILPILIYIYFGYQSSKKLLRESNDFEKRFLLKNQNDA